MAGEDTQILANETVDNLTIISSPNSKLLCGPGNGVICNGVTKHNNNGLVANGKNIEIVSNGKRNPSEKNPNGTTLDFDDQDVICGWGPCTPKWLQRFASKQVFLVIFCITWVLQGMYYTYFVSVITTIEKLFQIQSKTTGIIMSATEIGQIGSSLLLTYYGGQGHRPKWIAWGMVLFAVSSFSCSMPHFIFGDQLIRQNEMLFSGVSGGNKLNASYPVPANLCKLQDHWENITTNPNKWLTTTPAAAVDSHSNSCKEEFLEERRIHSKITTIVLAIFFVSLLGVGMGQTAVYTLGIPYIDDNVANRESPLYFAITIGVRILGPALGFILGSLCTMIYADLSANPQITPSDPRWVGAWWLGLVLVSAMLMLASVAMFAFPGRLPSGKTLPKRDESTKPSLKDFPKAVKRLLKNDILMFRTASSVLHILPIAGLYTFLPKYLESQFRLPAHHANMISGVGGILVMGLGIVMSGVFILKIKPNARFVAGWIAFTAIAYALGMGTLMFVGCPMDDFAGLQLHSKKTFDTEVFRLSSFQPTCDTTCECDRNKFNPICGADGKTYFSACHAGCSNYTVENGKIASYSDCQCIGQNSTSTNNVLDTATIGYCKPECNNFWIYMILFSTFVFIHSTSEVGSMLLILRCVDPRDKAMALGLIQFAIGLFGNVPCPIVYGAVVDSACLVWDAACGERGACWLYDSNIFRMFYHGTTGGILLCAFVMDIVVWYKAGSISFSDENEEGTVEEMVNLKRSDRRQTENEYL
ncbi:solute carrier organic anion transporter family member 74D [Athalia rosae]|uniref:solute carrier organic anion transporter family member 74D n=1 Tax=Athalia rosae TaxID=37344 RepID=UPI00203321B9|nr:solute carrier organic anion transporter family member 74D [Athalia rosae]XP_012262394.2 solute carrier organic anion transporter family member 74D [Athalia rosae]XP_012262396.2 solute carrier organic anion transporter family member 74D [Athalia rosae]XP_020710118.2 solute carrier organic anion transporter family member 74D [Athalia rosae]XP_020710119.2 solute carrier organic anion transporter family member 74D [Athalia rosae]XP_020710120.2 solute carrier organic anion transporter family me